jgi:NAD(P)-dependent dehydrogenase (short-subunit alcohol dehydrogenase family)
VTADRSWPGIHRAHRTDDHASLHLRRGHRRHRCCARIGLAIARRSADEGAKVVLADLDEEGVLGAASEIRDAGAGGPSAWAETSGSSREVDRLFDLTLKEIGTVDVLVNNAANNSDQRHLFDGDENW